MKYLRIFALSMHRAGYIKSRCVVWFIMSLFVPSVVCLYWVAAIKDNPVLSQSFSQGSIVTYYITTITLSALLVSHLKEHIMQLDIQNGEMARYLLRPVSYYWHNTLFHEMPFRILQGGYGIIVFTILWLIFPHLFTLHLDVRTLFLGCLSGVMGFFICANLEMMLGFLAFWFYELKLIFNAYEVIAILLGGFNMPLYFFPKLLSDIASLTPFPSVVYYPTLIFTQYVPYDQVYVLLGQQLVWLLITSIGYQLMWKRGIQKFTAAGI